MIFKDNFISLDKREFYFKNNQQDGSITLNKGATVNRITVCNKADVTFFVDSEETEKIINLLEAAIYRSEKEERGFCGPLSNPQLGDFSKEVEVIIQVVFSGKYIGISIDFTDSSQGDEIWLNKQDTAVLLNYLNWLKAKR